MVKSAISSCREVTIDFQKFEKKKKKSQRIATLDGQINKDLLQGTKKKKKKKKKKRKRKEKISYNFIAIVSSQTTKNVEPKDNDRLNSIIIF